MTYRKLLAAALLSGFLFSPIHAEAPAYSSENGATVRLAALHVPDYTIGGSSAWGFELGYASPIFPFENMSFSWGHISTSGIEHNYFLLNFEDSYPLPVENLSLVGGSGVGIVLLDQNPGSDKNSAVGRLSVGARYDATPRVSLFADVNFLISYENMWFDGASRENRTWQYLVGLSYLF